MHLLCLGARGREFDSRITPFCYESVAGVMVSIAAFQAVDPGSIPGPRTFCKLEVEKLKSPMRGSNPRLAG